MAYSDPSRETPDLHPIDIVETLATTRDWSFDRMDTDQISMEVAGSWRTYAVTLVWSDYDETLRLVCSFEMDPPRDKMPALFETLNLTNDRLWTGSFAHWSDQNLMVYRYGLVLSGGALAQPEQIDQMMQNGVLACERFYPAFQLACWGDTTPQKAMDVAISEAYGRA